jgi:broad specificity phosphatase PhoE
MRFVLVRHCETDWNAEGRLQGLSDRELSTVGRAQAWELAGELLPLGITRMVSSDLQRAVQTAEILNVRLRVPISLDQRLRECSFGRFEGLTWPEVEELFKTKKELHYRGAENSYDLRAVGGDRRDDIARRHLEVVQELKELFPSERVLLVGHGTGLNTLLCMLGEPVGLFRGEYRIVDYP